MRIERHGRALVVVGGPVPKGSDAITIGPIISMRQRSHGSSYLLAHELVHVRQWRRHGLVGFAWRYSRDYLRGRLAGHGHWGAYRRIHFEVEADWIARRRARS